ncbi:hypothetical protein [Peijinzhouia sedimentorum]
MFDTEIKSLKSFNHYLIKLVENRLWLKVIFALFLGVGFGLLLSPQNGWISKETADIAGNWLALPGVLFFKIGPNDYDSVDCGFYHHRNSQ